MKKLYLPVLLLSIFAFWTQVYAQAPAASIQNPFPTTSYFKTKLGSGIITSGLGVNSSTVGNLFTERTFIHYVNTNNPNVELREKGFSVPFDTYCQNLPHTGQIYRLIPMPSGFVISDGHANGNGVFIWPNGDYQQVYQFERCSTGSGTAATQFGSNPNGGPLYNIFSLDGQFKGTRFGSDLSTLGGLIRIGELSSPVGTKIEHTIMLNMSNAALSFVGGTGFRWPATVADGNASTNYVGTNSHVVMGSLITVTQGVTPESVGIVSEPAKKIFYALQEYGGLVVDEQGDFNPSLRAWGISVETATATDFPERTAVQNTYGIDISSGYSAGTWQNDMRAIFDNMLVVENADETNPKGPGIAPPPVAGLIPQSQLSIFSISSEELDGPIENAPGTNMFDQNIFTHWHSEYTPTVITYPHEFVVNLGASYQVQEVRTVSRQGNTNGVVGDFEIYVGTDGITWGSPDATNTGEDTSAELVTTIPGSPTGQFVRLVALNSVHGADFAAFGEFNVVGIPTGTTVAVPNVVGLTEASATSTIDAVSGLSVGSVTQENHASIAVGNVISQNPVAGSNVSTPSTVSLVVSLGPVPSTGPTHWVAATGGDDARTCAQIQNESTPAQTIQRGVDCHTGPGFVRVKAGTYTEYVDIDSAQSGVEGNEFILEAETPGTVTIDVTGLDPGFTFWPVIRINGGSYIQVRDFTLAGVKQSLGADAIMLGIYNSANHILIHGIISDGSKRSCIELADHSVSFITIEDSDLRNQDGAFCIFAQQATNVLVRNNFFRRTTAAVNGNTDFISIQSSQVVLVEGNITENGCDGIDVGGNSPVLSTDVIIRNNVVRSAGASASCTSDRAYPFNGGVGNEANGHNDISYLHNIASGTADGDAQGSGYQAYQGVKDITLFGNVAYKQFRPIWLQGACFGTHPDAEVRDFDIRNNILIGRSASTGAMHQWDFPDLSTIHVSHNHLWDFSGSPTPYKWDLDGDDNGVLCSDTLADLSISGYTAQYPGQGLSSSTGDPLFTDPATEDFTLQSGSPAIDTGDFYMLTTSNGNNTTVIPVNRDPGKYFTTAAMFHHHVGDVVMIQDATPPTATVVSLNSTSITVDTPMTFIAGKGVHRPWLGSSPDMGVFETSTSGGATAIVPSVTNTTQASAVSVINATNGLSVGDITFANSGSVTSGFVISQNPAAGSVVAQPTSVDIVVSIGVASSNDQTIWVDGVNGNDANDGLTEGNAKATIQAGIDAAPNGYLILIKPDIYYESPTINGKNDLYIVGFPRGGARISGVTNVAAREGTATWTADGDNRWRISAGGFQPPFLGYHDGTKWWLLPWLKLADLNDHVLTPGTSCPFQGNPDIPERGFALSGGDIVARFANNDDPNGKTVVIPNSRYTGIGLTLINSDRITIDGVDFEASQGGCIDADVNSDDLLLRNIEFEYCETAARLSHGGVVEWVRDAAPGLLDYERETTFDMPAGQTSDQAVATFVIQKEYDPLDDNDCLRPSLEGNFLEGHDATSLQVSNSVVYDSFDSITYDGQSNSTYSHMILHGFTDNAVETELDVGTGGQGNRLTQSYILGYGFEPFSFQTNTDVQVVFDHLVVEFFPDDYHDNINRVFKQGVVHPSMTAEFYNNLIQMQQKDFFSTPSEANNQYVFWNNIFTADTSGGDHSNSVSVSNNLYVRSSENTIFTANNGIFRTNTADINWNEDLVNYGVGSGSVVIDAGRAISGITDGFSGAAPDIGPFESTENPGPVLTVWPRPFDKTYDTSVPSRWTGDLPPSEVVLIAVPNVVGLTQAAGESAITSAGLVVGTVTQSSQGGVPSGTIVSQNPLSGTLVESGSTVDISVSQSRRRIQPVILH